MAEREARMRYRVKGTNDYVPRADVSLSQQFSNAGSAPYQAASQAPRLARWRWSSGGPNATLGGSLHTVRGRSRQTARNDGIADNGLETIVSAWVGDGIKPQWNTGDPAFDRKLADLWLEWTDEADADERVDFYGLEGLALRSMLEGGDVFPRLRTRRVSDGLSVPLQIQLLESEFVPSEMNQLGTVGYIQNGIEFDQIGKRVFYHMFPDHPGEAQKVIGSQKLVRVPAGDVMHLATIKRPGTVRGEPWLTRAVVRLFNLAIFDDAVLEKQKLSNLFAGIVSPSGAAVMSGQSDPDAAGVSVAPLEPGGMQVLDGSAEITMTDPPGPAANYGEFMAQQLRMVAVSMGILYEQATGDYRNVNDRTWRAAMNEFRRRVTRMQFGFFIFQFCRPAMRRWVDLAMMVDRIKVPAGVPMTKVYRPDWIPPAWPYINPVQDVQAKRDEVRAGFKSRKSQVSGAGDDVHLVDEEIASDNARADAKNLAFDSDGRRALTTLAAAQPPVDQEPTDDPTPAPPAPPARADAMPPIVFNVSHDNRPIRKKIKMTRAADGSVTGEVTENGEPDL